jgi:hypothetical protein
LFVLAGCEAVLYGSVLTSGVAVNELSRHTLPKLENIDRVEVEYCPDADFHNTAVLNLVEPESINQLVLAMNNNRSWWKYRLQIVPERPKEAQIKSKLASVFTRDEFHMNFFTSSI